MVTKLSYRALSFASFLVRTKISPAQITGDGSSDVVKWIEPFVQTGRAVAAKAQKFVAMGVLE